MKTLRPYQQRVLNWAEANSKIALFLEMRLGKTLIAIRWANQLTDKKKLVIAPLYVLSAWEKELAEEKEEYHFITTTTTLPNTERQVQWYLVNYEKVRRNPKILWKDFRVIILDESTRIKNPKSQIVKVLDKNSRHIPYRAVLSGCPAPEGPLDYYQQFHFLSGEFLGCKNYWNFAAKWFRSGLTQWELLPSKTFKKALPLELEQKAFTLTRKQVKLGPEKIKEKYDVTLPKQIQEIYKEALIAYRLGTKSTEQKIVLMQMLSILTGGFHKEYPHDAKTSLLTSILKTELKDEQVVIWCAFNAEVEGITVLLRKYFKNAAFVTGEVSLKQRKLLVEQFQKGEFKYLVAQIKCAKFGLDLSAADTAIYYSNQYAMEDRLQSEDRILSTEKKEPLLYVDLVARNTVDEHVINLLEKKRLSVEALMEELG